MKTLKQLILNGASTDEIEAHAKTLDEWEFAVVPTLDDPDVDVMKTLKSLCGIGIESDFATN